MKRAAQFLIVALIVVSFASNSLAQDEENLFDGFWKTRRGSIVKIDGDQGIFVYTPVESWKGYIDKVIIRNIHQEDDKWISDEYIAPNGKGFWAEIEWELNKNRIIRRILFEGKTVESYYERVAAVSDNPGIHLDNPGTHSSTSSPRSIEGRFGIGARVAYVNYSDDGYRVSGVGIGTEPDDAVMYGLNLTYFLHRYFSLELSGDYVNTDVELDRLGVTGDGGELTQVPVLLTGRIHFSTNPKVNPYFGGGVGYYFNDFDSEGVMAGVIYEAGAEIKVDDSVGYHVSAGVEIFVADNAAVNLDFKYIWNEIEVGNVPGFTDDEFDANAFVAGVGFKYYF